MNGRAGNHGASWRGMLSSSNQMCVMCRKQGRLSKDGLCSWIAQAKRLQPQWRHSGAETAWVESPRKDANVVEP
jgi:hypothetical protein